MMGNKGGSEDRWSMHGIFRVLLVKDIMLDYILKNAGEGGV